MFNRFLVIASVLLSSSPAMADWKITNVEDDFGRPTGELSFHSIVTPTRRLHSPFHKEKGFFLIRENCSRGYISIDAPYKNLSQGQKIPYLIDGEDKFFISSGYDSVSISIQDKEIKNLLNILLDGKESFEVVLHSSGYGSAHLTFPLDGFKDSLEKACPNF